MIGLVTHKEYINKQELPKQRIAEYVGCAYVSAPCASLI